MGTEDLSGPPGFAPPGFGLSAHQQPPQQQQQQLHNYFHLTDLQRGQKSKRSKDKKVSWADGEKFCQVRLFIPEDAPSMSGAIQDQLQAKPIRNLHVFSTNSSLPLDAPPGFGGASYKPKPDYVLLASINPQIPWRIPRLIDVERTWEVGTGSDSKEVELQKQREVRTLEAVYPRLSSIPDNPAEPMEAQEPYDDSTTPQIPLVPLDEEDSPEPMDEASRAFDASSGQDAQSIPSKSSDLSSGILDKMRPQQVGNGGPVPTQENSRLWQEIANSWRGANGVSSSQAGLVESDPTGGKGRPVSSISAQLGDIASSTANLLGRVEPDIHAAAAAVLAALTNSQEMGNMIDNELLVQILSDPSILQGLKQSPHNSALNVKKLDLPMNLSDSGSASQGSIAPPLAKFKQMQALNIPGSGNSSNKWSGAASFVQSLLPAVGSDGGSNRIREMDPTFNSGDRPLRPVSIEDRASKAPMMGGVGRSGDSQQMMYKPDPFMTGARLGPSAGPPRPANAVNSDPPRGFSGDVGSRNSSGILGGAPFSSKPPFQHGPAAPLGHTAVGNASGSMSGRPVSQFNEQYYKNLILQHGCKSANDDDHGRLVMDNTQSGNSGKILPKSSNAFNSIVSPESTNHWFPGENVDGLGSGPRSARDRRDPADRNKFIDPETSAPRPKSRRLCMYYNTARGCRNGDNCSFVHEKMEVERPRADRVRGSGSAAAGAPTTALPLSKRLRVDG